MRHYTKNLKKRKITMKKNKKNKSKKRGGMQFFGNRYINHIRSPPRITLGSCVIEQISKVPDPATFYYLMVYCMSCHSGKPGINIVPQSFKQGDSTRVPTTIFPESKDYVIGPNLTHIYGAFCQKNAKILAQFSKKVTNYLFKETLDLANMTGKYARASKKGLSNNSATLLYRGDRLENATVQYNATNMPSPMNDTDNYGGIFFIEPQPLGISSEIQDYYKRNEGRVDIDFNPTLKDHIKSIENLHTFKEISLMQSVAIISQHLNDYEGRLQIERNNPNIKVLGVIIEIACRTDSNMRCKQIFTNETCNEDMNAYNSNATLYNNNVRERSRSRSP